MPIQQQLGWDAFIVQAEALGPDGLDLPRLKALVERLVLAPDFLEGRIRFCDEAYARNLIYRSELFEAVCLCWQGEQRTSIHDHGRSYGVAVVQQGVMREEVFRRSGDRVHQVHAHDVTPGAVSAAPVGMIHRLGNGGGPGTRLVSVHFYAGPLDEMNVFDQAAGTVTRKPMRYLSDGELPPTS